MDKPPFRVLVFAREFNRGDAVSDFCYFLSGKMKALGIATDLVCYSPEYSEAEFPENALSVFRVPFALNADTFFNWALLMNAELKRKGRELAEKREYLMVIGNDWTGYPAASSIAALFNIPLATVFSSTEQNRGFSYENSRLISDIEWEASDSSRRVVALSNDCRNSLVYDLKVPQEKILTVDGLLEYVRLLEEVLVEKK